MSAPVSVSCTDSHRYIRTSRSCALALVLALALAVDLRGPSVAAEAADKTRRAPNMDVRRFTRGQDAPSENPAGSADPVCSPGRAGGGCSLCTWFLCSSKERDRK